ncbi:MAG: tetratricopeptide repeat protein [Myxococcaceae bacterium]|nr:tetratricopeptide repeat protein [Myxococcaceae bacterium]
MSKSMVEKYEQMLSQDPTSTVFVELARAYLDKGENDKAIEVCKQGCTHHPESVAGRVLWGKGLINSGRAAEAMQQFDAAANIDKDNPHAYNLISEVLLRKGLYRSALPILRKASTLQPNDGRIKQWLEQARAALAGGPAPILYDETSVTQALPSAVPAAPALGDGPAAATSPVVPVVAAPAARPSGPRPPASTEQHPSGRHDAAPAARPSGPRPPASAEQHPSGRHHAAPPSPGDQRPSGRHPQAQTAELPAPPTDSSPSGEFPNADPDVFAAFAPAKPDPRAEPTVVMSALGEERTTEVPTQTAQVPEAWPSAPRPMDHRPGPPVPTGDLPIVGGSVAARSDDNRPTMELPVPAHGSGPVVVGALEDRTATAELPIPVARSAPPVGEAPDPFAALTGRTESTETFRGLTSTFQALEEAEAAPLPLPLPPAPPVPSDPNLPSVIPSDELQLPPATPAAPAKPPGLLDDVVSAQNEVPTSEFQMPGMNQVPARAAPAPVAAPRAGSGGLLDEIPDHFEPPSAVEAPRVEFSTQATEAIAREYERELREKLQAKVQEKTFFQKHGVKLGVGAAVVVVGIALVGSFLYTRQRHGGENLESALAKGLLAINADTKEQYTLALQSLEQALSMDEGNADAWANIALAKAILYAEHGGALADRTAAQDALNKPKVREAHPEIAVVVDYLVADAADLAGRRQQLLGSELSQSLVEAQAGRVLLTDRKLDEAFKHLQRATELNSRNLRALVTLGEYYLLSEDYESAARILSTAETLSKYHPQRVMGLAEARLELARESQEALADLEGLPANAAVREALKGRYTLLLGRAQSAAGRHDDAAKTLTEGMAANKDLAFDFEMALGMAARNAGRMAEAQKAYEAAIALRPKSEEAKEGLGRVLLARSREKELLERFNKPDDNQRKVALVRGIAAVRLEDPRRARAEFDRTRVSGKYPAEAVVYLALIDAAEESGDKAVQALEKLVATQKRHKATAQIALARVYMKRNELMKARAQLEEAARDPQDYEANALLGQLYLEAVDMGVPPETALAPLQKAVERNGSHGPSRHLLTRTLLALGQFPEATKMVESWTADNPQSEEAWVDAAFVYLHTGRFKDAEAAIAKLKPDSTDPQAFRVKAQVLYARGDARNGLASLERANKLNPKDAETFCEIGNAFVRQGNADTALKAYEAARRENAKALCGLVGPHHAKPTAKGARPTPKEELLALQKQAFAVWDRALVDASLARVLLEERDLKHALEQAEAATRAAPFSAPAWFAMGEVARKQKNDAKALEAWGKAAEYDPSWAQARLAYADALMRAGGEGPAKALPEYEAVLGLTQNEAELARVKKVVTALKKQLK